MATTLTGILSEALSQAKSVTGPLLLPKLQAAELELKQFSKELPLLPDYNVSTVREAISAKRAELWAQAIADHAQETASIEAEYMAEAFFSYLKNNNICTYLNGSLTAPSSGGPVVGGPPVARVNYS